MSQARPVRIFTTGGTIDKIYFDAASDFKVGEPQVCGLLQEAGVTGEYAVTSLLRKDSLELTAEDRELIRGAVLEEPWRHILITHGTDTMVETARHLGDAGGRTVVFTGAMQPARFRVSDAVFNVGFALGVLHCAEPGVYLAMNGQVFDPAHVHKNRAAHRFETD